MARARLRGIARMAEVRLGAEVLGWPAARRRRGYGLLKGCIDEVRYAALIAAVTIDARVVLARVEHAIPTVGRRRAEEKPEKKYDFDEQHPRFDWSTFYILEVIESEELEQREHMRRVASLVQPELNTFDEI